MPLVRRDRGSWYGSSIEESNERKLARVGRECFRDRLHAVRQHIEGRLAASGS